MGCPQKDRFVGELLYLSLMQRAALPNQHRLGVAELLDLSLRESYSTFALVTASLPNQPHLDAADVGAASNHFSCPPTTPWTAGEEGVAGLAKPARPPGGAPAKHCFECAPAALSRHRWEQ